MPFTWHGFSVSVFALYIHTFFLITNMIFSVCCQPTTNADCILDFETMSSFSDSSLCDGGKWGGFLKENCLDETLFCDYLYALALRANQTGKIFLNSDEWRKCSSKTLKANEADGWDCGMENLTAGVGGCSDFSTVDVETKLGYELGRLKEKCGVKSGDVEWEFSCSSCLRSWEEMKENKSTSDHKYMKFDSEVCSFAILVTLVSTEVKNEAWASKLYSCLANEKIKKGFDFEVVGHAQRKKMRPGLWILIGGAVGLLVVMIVSILILSRRRKKSPIAPVNKDAWRPALSNFPTWKPVLSAISDESQMLKFSIEEVFSATNNLVESNLIGEGTSGKVYRGVLSNNQHVAIKKMTNEGCVDTFLREIKCLLHLRHRNLVALLGYCENGSECFLIYELCPNGNLSEWLYGKDKVFSWIRRLEIAIDSAKGLRFLHTFPEGCIVHRDVKPTNILLGSNFEAKLSDFGLSKVMNVGDSSVSSEVRGTFGYVDPEYQNDHHISAASDIYSFGMVLLQILSGKKVIDMTMKKPKPIKKIAKSYVKNGKLVEFVDPNLDGEYSIEAFGIIFELALLCTGQKRERPSIGQVIEKLEEALSISMRIEPSTPQTRLV